MGGINDDRIGAGCLQHGNPVDGICLHTDRSSDQQTAAGILAGDRVVLDFHQVLVSDQADQPVVLIDNGKFLDLAAHQDIRRFSQADTLAGRDQMRGSHHIGDGTPVVNMEPKVAVGNDADQVTLGVHDRDAADVVAGHHGEGVADRRIGTDGDRVIDHAVLRSLDTADLLALRLDGHVLVNDTDTAGTGHGNRQFGLGYGIHGR